jgi:hypothetical protein
MIKLETKSNVLLSSPGGEIQLKSCVSMAAQGVEIDQDAGIIKNVSVIQAGPSSGHQFEVDSTMLSQVADKINLNEKGVVSRLSHPGMTEFGSRDPVELILGRVRNAKVEKDKVRADLHLGGFSKHKDFVMAIADEDPELIGMSIVFWPAEFETQAIDEPRQESIEVEGSHFMRFARVESVVAVDAVGEPAANRDGLLSRNKTAAPNAATHTPPTPHGSGNTGANTVKLNQKSLAFLKARGLDNESPTKAIVAGIVAKMSTADAAEFVKLSTESESEPMAPTAPTDPPATTTAAPDPVVPAAETVAQTAGKIAAKILAANDNRIKEVRALASQHSFGAEWAFDHILGRSSLDAVREDALSKLSKTGGQIPNITGGDNLNLSSIKPAIVDAIMLRTNATIYKTDDGFGKLRLELDSNGKRIEERPHERAREFRHLSVVDMARAYFAALGVPNVQMLSRSEIVALMGPRNFYRAYPTISLAQSTGDFGSLLMDAASKRVTNAYLDAPEDWSLWARRTTAPDFKNINVVGLSESPNLVKRKDGAEVKYVSLSDTGEVYALSEYTGGIKITRQALINDDLRAFDRLPQIQGSAARRQEMDLAYGILTDNAAMADAVALFDQAGHGNYTTTGTALSVASLSVAETAMMTQKGPQDAAFLQPVPKFLLVPATQKAVGDQLVGSVVDPSKSNSAANPYANKLTVIPSARLNADSTTAWYLAADYRDGQVDTVEVAFLDFEPDPVLQQETDFDTGDMKSLVRHTVAAKAIDHRGLYKNDGA